MTGSSVEQKVGRDIDRSPLHVVGAIQMAVVARPLGGDRVTMDLIETILDGIEGAECGSELFFDSLERLQAGPQNPVPEAVSD